MRVGRCPGPEGGSALRWIGQGGSFHSRSTVAIASALAVGVLALFPTHASASHDWLHYRKVWDPTNSDYSAYAYTDSDKNNDQKSPWRSDYIWARIQVNKGGDVIRRQSAYCGPLADGCHRTTTTTVTWPQGTAKVFSAHCGYDDWSGKRHFIRGNMFEHCGEVLIEWHWHETNVG